jgi:hypothetical protein
MGSTNDILWFSRQFYGGMHNTGKKKNHPDPEIQKEIDKGASKV